MSRYFQDVFGDVDSSYPFEFDVEAPEVFRSRRKNKKRKPQHRRQLRKRKKAAICTKKTRSFRVIPSLTNRTTKKAKQPNCEKSVDPETEVNAISRDNKKKYGIMHKQSSGTKIEQSSTIIDVTVSVRNNNKRHDVSGPEKNTCTLCDLFARIKKERAAYRRVVRKIVTPKHLTRPQYKCLIPCYEYNVRDYL